MRFAGFLLSLVLTLQVGGAPFPIAGPRVGDAPGVRASVRVAASDEQYLLVWQDSRGIPLGRRAWAARMTRTGDVVDPTGLPLDEGTAVPSLAPVSHSVASDGRDFLVATQRADVLRFVRVTREGTTEAAPVPGFAARSGHLVWIGDAYAFFFDAPLGEKTVMNGARVAILDREGRILVQPRVVVSANSAIAATVTTSPDNSRTLLVWTDGSDARVYAAAVNLSALRAGTLRVKATPLAERASPPVYRLAVGSSPSRHFLAWSEGNELRGRLLDGNAAAAGEKFTIAQDVAQTLSVTWNGSRFVVAYSVVAKGGRRLMVAEYDETGTLRSTPLREATYGAEPQVASLQGDVLVAWTSAEPDGRSKYEIRADILSGSQFLRPAAGILVSRSLPQYLYPDAVWRGDHYLAVWTERSSRLHASMGRFDAQGRLLDGPGQLLGDGLLAAVATDGHDALVAVAAAPKLRLVHVGHDGRMTERTVETPSFGLTDVLWTGDGYAFCSGALIGTANADGTIRKVVQRAVTSDDCNLQRVGNDYALLWSVRELCFPFCYRPTFVRAQSYSRNLSPLGSPATLAGPDIDENSFPLFRAAPAGDRTLVVWRTIDGMLRGTRISSAGVLLDPRDGFPIGMAATLTDVHADGEGWVVGSGPYAWTVTRSGTVSERVTKYPFVPELREAFTVIGGPAPLVIHQTEPGGAEQVERLVGQFVIPRKQRASRR